MLQTIKCVAVGDGAVGKTNCMINYALDTFYPDHTKTELEVRTALQIVENQRVNLELWDTGGKEGRFESERQRAYENTDIFLLTFSLINPSSLQNIKRRWLPDIQKACPDAPYILVGTKLDMRERSDVIKTIRGKGGWPVTYEDGLAMAKDIKALKYFECSALTKEGIKEMFREVIQLGLSQLQERKRLETLAEEKSFCTAM